MKCKLSYGFKRDVVLFIGFIIAIATATAIVLAPLIMTVGWLDYFVGDEGLVGDEAIWIYWSTISTYSMASTWLIWNYDDIKEYIFVCEDNDE